MNKIQSEVLKLVYSRLIESESSDAWTELDDNLEFFDYLSDREVIDEAHIKYGLHSKGIFKCAYDHDDKDCFAPYILEAVEAILSLNSCDHLHEKSRYVLSYYLVMTELKLLFSVNVASGAV